MDKKPLLSEHPSGRIGTLSQLVGLANAIEEESVARYEFLANEMERRGDPETAGVFREMREMEAGHVEQVGRWAAKLGEPVPPPEPFLWLLPPDIARSWEEAGGSTLLTPYRALAIAVTNEERAFALYVYMSAQAADPEVARQAEVLAQEELGHAAQLRVRRRVAFRREHPSSARSAIPDMDNPGAFMALERNLEGEAARCHADIARRLATAGASACAEMIGGMAEREREAASGQGDVRGSGADALPASADVPALLRAALQPLERSSEIYEELIGRTAREDVLNAAQVALSRTVGRIASIGARLEEIERAR